MDDRVGGRVDGGRVDVELVGAPVQHREVRDPVHGQVEVLEGHDLQRVRDGGGSVTRTSTVRTSASSSAATVSVTVTSHAELGHVVDQLDRVGGVGAVALGGRGVAQPGGALAGDEQPEEDPLVLERPVPLLVAAGGPVLDLVVVGRAGVAQDGDRALAVEGRGHAPVGAGRVDLRGPVDLAGRARGPRCSGSTRSRSAPPARAGSVAVAGRGPAVPGPEPPPTPAGGRRRPPRRSAWCGRGSSRALLLGRAEDVPDRRRGLDLGRVRGRAEGDVGVGRGEREPVVLVLVVVQPVVGPQRPVQPPLRAGSRCGRGSGSTRRRCR